MRDKFMRFMIGRYGVDSLSRCMMGMALGLMVVNLFTRWKGMYWVAIALIVCVYFRMFSKNVYKRADENQRFLKWTAGIRSAFVKEKRKSVDRKTHRIYKCPNCKQKIRVPKGKGKIAITCPKCHIEFIKKS